MRAHEEPAERRDGNRDPGARRPQAGPTGVGPLDPQRALALQGQLGNRAVARLVEENRSAHGGADSGQRAGQQAQPTGPVAHVQRAGGGGNPGRGDGNAGGAIPSRQEIVRKVDELAAACTCKQSLKQWGRVTKDVVIRYARSYENDREGQSLRHLDRQLFNAIAVAEHKEREGDGGKGKAPAGEKAAGEKAANREQEIQAMLVNGHLIFASNYNRSMARLYEMLRELSGGEDAAKDLGNSDSLQNLMQQDLGEQANASVDSDSDSESEAESETEEAPPGKAPGKRSASVRDEKADKRRKIHQSVEESDQTAEATDRNRRGRTVRKNERERRNRQATLKIREGFTLNTQAMPPVEPEAMDVDEPAEYKRDNDTLRALRKTSHIRLVDISNEAASVPAYRKYLAQLLEKGGGYPGYAYLVHDGKGVGKMHAEQKLLQMLQNAEFTGADAEVIHIRGTKRPCDACLALLSYFKEQLGLHLRFNSRGNQYYQEAVETGVRHLSGHDESRSAEVGKQLGDRLGDEQRHMYVSAPKGTKPKRAEGGLRGAVPGAAGGMEQQYTVPKYTTSKGATVRKFPDDAEFLEMDDSGSDSEVDEDASMTGVVAGTRELRIGTEAGAPAPNTAEERQRIKEQQQKEAQEEFEKSVVPKLRNAAGKAFWQEVEARPPTGAGKFKLEFPAALRQQIKILADADSTIKSRICARLKLSLPALNKQLDKIDDDTRKSRYRIEQVEGAKKRLEEAIPADFRSERQTVQDARSRGEDVYVKAAFSDDFKRLLRSMVDLEEKRISENSIAEVLCMANGTFKARMKTIRGSHGTGPAKS